MNKQFHFQSHIGPVQIGSCIIEVGDAITVTRNDGFYDITVNGQLAGPARAEYVNYLAGQVLVKDSKFKPTLDEWVKRHNELCTCSTMHTDDLSYCDCGQPERLRELAELRVCIAVLDDAIELAEEGISYTPDYFREKWDMDDRLAELKKVAKENNPDGQSSCS